MNFKSYNEFIEDCKKFVLELPRFSSVSYIPRSGMIPAFIYSKLRNVPLIPLEDVNENTLVFDDSIRSGRALEKTKKAIDEHNKVYQLSKLNPKYAVVYYAEGDYDVDFKYEFIYTPRIFEWNWLCQENLINNSCFDLDGVLCEFPIEKLQSGELDYFSFLKNAKPKYIPKYEIGAIVTGRVEKYRKETEEWLKKHNVKYKKLIMLNYTEEERRRLGLHTVNKISEYLKNDYVLFVEDEIYQAELISIKTKKPVLCVSNMKIYN